MKHIAVTAGKQRFATARGIITNNLEKGVAPTDPEPERITTIRDSSDSLTERKSLRKSDLTAQTGSLDLGVMRASQNYEGSNPHPVRHADLGSKENGGALGNAFAQAEVAAQTETARQPEPAPSFLTTTAPKGI